MELQVYSSCSKNKIFIMKIFVTGATGFIGLNLVKALERKKVKVLAFARKTENFKDKNFKYIQFFSKDIYKNKKIFEDFGIPDILVHLAWEGLPNYQENFHLEKNLPNDLSFLKRAINAGVKQIIISGTCYEYGKQEGCLSEANKTIPYTKYAKAKDQLRKKLEKIKIKKQFILQWIRIFYPFGKYQNEKSLIPSLDKAIKEGKKNFGITSKSIVRDFIPINDVINFIIHLIYNKKLNGVINCCSGKPQTIFQFVLDFCKKKNSKIKIVPNKFPIPDHEPIKFWGSTNKMTSLSFKLKNKFF